MSKTGALPSTSPFSREHIGDIFADEELSPDACRKKFGNSEFQQKAPFYYNFDLIIAVGFRVRSRNGVIFRKWAGERLRSTKSISNVPSVMLRRPIWTPYGCWKARQRSRSMFLPLSCSPVPLAERYRSVALRSTAR